MKYTLFLISLLWLSLSTTKAQKSTEVTFLTKDSIQISATYQVPKVGKAPYPAIILIHQGGSSRREWADLPMVDRLLEYGYAILAYDVRMHGKSGKDAGNLRDLFNNPNRAPLDLLAAIQFLNQDSRIDPERIGIVGASIGANLACVAAASDRFKVKTVVVLSAKTQAVKNLSGSSEALHPSNAFYIASEEEQGGLRDQWAHELFGLTSGTKLVSIAPGDKHGSYILKSHRILQDDIIHWFKRNL